MASKPGREQHSDLKWFQNPIVDSDAFNHIDSHLASIQSEDICYQRKFRKDQLVFPYFLSLFKNPKRNQRKLLSQLKKENIGIILSRTPRQGS